MFIKEHYFGFVCNFRNFTKLSECSTKQKASNKIHNPNVYNIQLNSSIVVK